MVVKCKRCGKHVCANENCQVPHALGVCGDKFANEKARAIANDLPPRSFAPKDAWDPTDLLGNAIPAAPVVLAPGTLMNRGGKPNFLTRVVMNRDSKPIRLSHDSPANKVTFTQIGRK